MKNKEVEALAWFGRHHAKVLNRAERILIIHALPGAYLNQWAGQSVTCLQPYYPYAQVLKQQGYSVVTECEDRFDLVVYFGTRFRDENLFTFARSRHLLQANGTFLCVMSNALGASRYEKLLADLYGEVRSASKAKCRMFWVEQKQDLNETLLADWLQRGTLHPISDTGLWAYSGIFSTETIDRGSLILMETISSAIKGRGADLGAGYGYLSYTLLQQQAGIEAIHLYEADHRALKAAQHNLKPFHKGVALTFHWADVTEGVSHQKLDWVIMNPPFHEGRHPNVQLGQQFIVSAAYALRKKGVLYLVANQHLPYETILDTHFTSVALLGRREGFKCYKAHK